MIVATKPEWEALRSRLRGYSPKTEMGRVVKESFRYLPPELAGEMLDQITRVVVLESSLHVVVYRADGSVDPLRDYGYGPGITSKKLITDNGVAFLVDAWQNTVELEIMKYHGLGTSSAAEGQTQTGLTTELTTQYATANTRPAGTLTESSAPVFVTVGVNTLSAGATINEHGLFSVTTAASGVLWDRSLTGAQTLSTSDSLQSTYSMTAGAGG